MPTEQSRAARNEAGQGVIKEITKTRENALKQDFNNNGARINASVRFLLDFWIFFVWLVVGVTQHNTHKPLTGTGSSVVLLPFLWAAITMKSIVLEGDDETPKKRWRLVGVESVIPSFFPYFFFTYCSTRAVVGCWPAINQVLSPPCQHTAGPERIYNSSSSSSSSAGKARKT